MDDGVCDYCNSNMNGDECSNPNCGTNIFRSRENEKRIEELEAQLAAVRKISDDGKLSWQQKHVAVWLAVHPEAAIGDGS